MDPIMIAAGLIVVTIAGVIQGLTGFGSALVMVPVLSMFLSPREVVPITLVLGTIMNLVIMVQARRSVDRRMLLPLFVPALVGIPIGTLVLLVLPAPFLRILIGGVIISFSLALLAGFSMEIRNERVASVPIGFASGVLNGSITMSGPPLILFFQNQGMDRARFRANLVTFFFVTNVVTMASFAIVARIHEGPFRRIALVIVFIAGLSSVITGVLGL
jgi:uncharacterized membrane protein YfcA